MKRWLRCTALASATVILSCKGSDTKKDPALVAEIVESVPNQNRGPVTLRQVVVREVSVDPRWPIDSQDIATRLGSLLLESGAMISNIENEGLHEKPGRAEVHLDLRTHIELPSENSPGNLVVAMEAKVVLLSGKRGLEPRSAVMVELALVSDGKPTFPELLTSLVSDALSRVAKSLSDQAELLLGEEAVIIAGLTSGDQPLRIWAMKIAADRKIAGSVDTLVSLLRDEDEEVAGQAITSLVEIGDVRSVSGIADLVDFKDYEELSVLLEAISAIGGQDAVEFLEFVASGHPSEELRDRAAKRLKRVQEASREIP